jgi:hypothetical protein
MAAWLDRYCREQPNDTLADAATALIVSRTRGSTDRAARQASWGLTLGWRKIETLDPPESDGRDRWRRRVRKLILVEEGAREHAPAWIDLGL